MIVTMAWKNLARYKRRTFVTACTVAAGVFLNIIFAAFINGMTTESTRNLLEYETAGARVYAPGYFTERKTYPVDYLIEENQTKEIETFFESRGNPAVPLIETTCEIYFTEEFFETSGSVTGILCGLNPKKAGKVFRFGNQDIFESGSWLEKDPDLPYCTGAVVGSWMAKDMKAQTGWYITIQCKGRDGFSQTMDVPIVGIINCPNPAVNSSYIFMDSAYLDEMLSMEGAVTSVAVNTGGVSAAASEEKQIRKAWTEKQNSAPFSGEKQPELYFWHEIADNAVATQTLYEAASAFMMLFMFIIAAVGISNTMIMSVMERKNEIAMLKAMGCTPLYIRALFVSEGIFIGILGCIMGFLLSVPVNIFMAAKGLDFTGIMSAVDIGYAVSGVFRSEWDFPAFINIMAGSLVFAGIASFFPAFSISKKEIAEIFRKN